MVTKYVEKRYRLILLKDYYYIVYLVFLIMHKTILKFQISIEENIFSRNVNFTYNIQMVFRSGRQSYGAAIGWCKYAEGINNICAIKAKITWEPNVRAKRYSYNEDEWRVIENTVSIALWLFASLGKYKSLIRVAWKINILLVCRCVRNVDVTCAEGLRSQHQLKRSVMSTTVIFLTFVELKLRNRTMKWAVSKRSCS